VFGEVFDVAVDIRRSSPTFGKWVGSRLSADNKFELWVPPGFAHGFLTLSDAAEVLYKATDFYSPENERSICWNDPMIDIDWPLDGSIQVLLSEKDKNASNFVNAEVYP
jgi:dTDP-4-dehydrorhamnose 3,5-epimerase